MGVILWLILIILGIPVIYFVIFFILKLKDNMQYGGGLISAIKQTASDCCASVKSAIRG
jgi:hypothetical protein